MKKFVTSITLITSFFLLGLSLHAADRFDRVGIIPAAPDDIGGFGNVVAGVDFDGDGLAEIYAVNTDWHDVADKDLIPRIYKYEKDDSGQWQTVWWTRLPFDYQNTWAALAPADLDNDGKMEIVWGPVNNTAGGLNPNPPRIVVFETPGDGTDVMGIDNGDGTYSPNAQWTIVDEANANLRPFRWIITDIDDDGTPEIVTALRAGASCQIYSVDNIPDNGDGSETWTLEFSGLEGTYYDIAVIGNTAYPIRDNGDVTPVTWDGSAYVVGTTQAGLVGAGSWKSASVVDIDDNGQEEILVASWSSSTRNVYLLQQDADTLKATIVNTPPAESFRLYGGAAGDLDNDGNVDFVFGTRQSTPNGIIHRLEYQGGAIDDPNSYELSIIDQGVSGATQYDIEAVANVDGEPGDEAIYSGTPRGLSASDPPQPIVILDIVPANQPIITDVQDVPNDQGRQVWVVWDGSEDDVGGTRFTANLSGDNEVGPVATVASGKATFILNDDHTQLSYLLEVANIDSVTQAHIHRGGPGDNGPVGVFLYGLAPAGGPVNGVLASGTITADDLIGPWAGDMDGFLNDLLTGNTYVNVHTTPHPAGEIRGQVLTDPLSKPRAPQAEGFTISHYVVWRVGPLDPAPVQVAQVQAIQLPTYAAVVPTLADGDTTEFTYVVSAHTANPTVLWKSAPKSGFSLDNLAPTAPTNLMVTEGETGEEAPLANLAWDKSPDKDFDYFVVVRGTEAGFDPATATVIGNTTEPDFVDANVAVGETFFYRVAAVDFNNNLGNFSAEVSLLVTSVGDDQVSALPKEFALHQNYPNPFNPDTKITYDLPKGSDVTLKIYNIMGQEVRTLVDEAKPAGSYTVRWDATNNSGTKVAGGVYVMVLRAADFVQTKRLTLVK